MTTTKICGGIVLVAALGLGAAACGSSNSSNFPVEKTPGDPNKIHTVAQFQHEQYWSVQSQVVVQAMQSNIVMASAVNVPADEGAMTDVLLHDSNGNALVSGVVAEIAQDCQTDNTSDPIFNLYVNNPDPEEVDGTCPAGPAQDGTPVPADAPAAAPPNPPATSAQTTPAPSQPAPAATGPSGSALIQGANNAPAGIVTTSPSPASRVPTRDQTATPATTGPFSTPWSTRADPG